MTSSNSEPSFTDAAGRTWRLSVSIGKAMTIKEATGLDFANIKDGTFFLDLRAKPETFGAVLWVLCEAQAKVANPPIAMLEFFDRLGGDPLDDARKAIQEALINFTPGARRAALRAALSKMEEAEEKTMETIREWTETSCDELLASVDGAVREMLETRGATSPS